MTGQPALDSYVDAGAIAAVELVNTVSSESDKITQATIAAILAIDPAAQARVTEADVPGFVDLARSLRRIFQHLDRGGLDEAAEMLNEMLAAHPAHPHLAKERGHWRLHHHPSDAELVPEWTSICAENVARLVGAGHASRFGICSAIDCKRVYIDLSKNRSRRFCSTTCQNRVKAAAFRQRHSTRRSEEAGPESR
jgi:predicted RNA-binding Zn ribbon-like protein